MVGSEAAERPEVEPLGNLAGGFRLCCDPLLPTRLLFRGRLLESSHWWTVFSPQILSGPERLDGWCAGAAILAATRLFLPKGLVEGVSGEADSTLEPRP